MILIDANVLMYGAGADHPHKEPSAALARRIGDGTVRAVLDAEVLREILHRYRALNRWDEGRRLYDSSRELLPTVLSITDTVVDQARSLLDRYPRLTARDAIHAAVVLEYGLEAICSYDRDFDGVEGVRRVEP